MEAYFDSAVIVKLYVSEANSPHAIQLTEAYPVPYCLTPWQGLEVKNAMRLKAFRGEITAAQLQYSMAALAEDTALGRWQRPHFNAAVVEEKAAELSALYSARLGCRTLDIIHVATALVIGASYFITFDRRQSSLAKQAGLFVKP
jgi:predicted nucleic acid-binding protein